MAIREFYFRFASSDESSVLFEILRRLSRLEELTSLAVVQDMSGWPTWPPDSSPDPGAGSGPALVASSA